MTTAKTTAQRQRTFRARKAEQQMTEVRGIFAHPDDHGAVKAAAVEIARKRLETVKSKAADAVSR